MDSTIESIVLIRHARSTANVDPTVYRTLADHAIPLVDPEADEGALAAAVSCGALGTDASDVCAWCSTYLRCQQTQTLVLRGAFGAAAEGIHRRESFLLREQEFGDWDGMTDEEIRERDPQRHAKRQVLTDSLGKFYFRYPGGESRADVVERMVIFIGKIHRSHYRHHIVFLHGVTQRAFRMAWFNRPVGWFEEEPNPHNASVLVIRRDAATGRWCERYLEQAR